MTSLRELHLTGNLMTGTVPSTLRSLDIELLRLDHNDFSGQMLDYVEDWPNLKLLHLFNTGITGTLPASIVQNKQLENIYLGSKVAGTFPTRLGEMTNLRSWFVAGKGIEGVIPDDIERLSKLGKLTYFCCALPIFRMPIS